MSLIFATLAVILCWIWIEIFIFISFIFNKTGYNKIFLSVKKFKWILRSLILMLFVLVIVYMFFFQTEELKKAISLCIGIIL